MQKYLSCLILLSLALLNISCENDEPIKQHSGNVTFSFTKNEIAGGKEHADLSPSAIILSIENTSGTVILENKRIDLLAFGNGYVSENILLQTGNYKLTSFIVLNETNQVIYAAPKLGSAKADLVSTPLPILFAVTNEAATEVKPEVLAISSSDSPTTFGYPSFQFEIVTPEKFPVSVKVQLTVGNIDYLDVDTQVKITGFNAANEVQWSEHFNYVGPKENLFKIRKGFHHYQFEIDHWGIKDKQIISGEHLLDGASTEVPTTYVLGGAREPKKLAYYVSYIERPDPANWGQTITEPQTSVEYLYRADGKVDKMKIYGYVASGNNFVEQRSFDFKYVGERLSQLSGFHPGEAAPYIDDFYSYYDNGNVSKIREVNYAGGVTSEVNVTYNFTDRLIKAVYTLSNGTGFEYEFNYISKNIANDKTTRFGSLCNTGIHTYDKNINPLAHLGYTDFLFQNYSVNNKIAENVNYVGCAFPTLIPESYHYKYDDEGFPTEKKTIYKGGNLVMMTKYEYQ